MENAARNDVDAFLPTGLTSAVRGLSVRERELASLPKRALEMRTSADVNGLGARIEIVCEGKNEVLAAASIVVGEYSDTLRAVCADFAVLRSLAVVHDVDIAPSDDPTPALALWYFVARRARIMDRVSVAMLRRDADGKEIAKMYALAPVVGIPGVLTQRVDLAVHYAHEALRARGKAVGADVRGREVEEIARRWLSTAREWGLFKAVHERTLTRQQYVYALSNIYQFVRHTTRLAARAIAHSPTTEMRSHFINHLSGEINHELIIEKDLAHMGEDVDYVRMHMAPNGPTQEFMAIQESLIGYYEDPVLLMASPVAAEGVTGHLTEEFIAALKECMASWGVASPDKASRFFYSHMHTDGGEDGHWEMTINYLGKVLVDESKHQFFLRSMRSAMRGTQRLYESFVTDVPNWPSQAQEADTRRKPPVARA